MISSEVFTHSRLLLLRAPLVKASLVSHWKSPVFRCAIPSRVYVSEVSEANTLPILRGDITKLSDIFVAVSSGDTNCRLCDYGYLLQTAVTYRQRARLSERLNYDTARSQTVLHGRKIECNVHRESGKSHFTRALVVSRRPEMLVKSRHKGFYVCASGRIYFEINPRNFDAFTL